MTEGEFKETEIGLIPENWELMPVKSFCKRITSGGTPSRKRDDYWDNGTILWLKTKELSDSNLYFTEEKITSEGLKNSSAKIFPIDTIIMAMYGATVGKLGIIKKDMATNQACCGLIVDNDISNNLFLFYALLNFRDKLINLACGAAQQNLNQDIIKNLILPFPSKEEQDKIAFILSSIDKKIELNQKMNQNLEEIGQSFFKHWFVHFEFPNEEEKPYKSSSGEMVNSELGEIPEGWKIGNINDIIINPISGDWGKETEEKNFSKETFCIRGADIPNISAGNESKAPTRFIKPEKFEKCHLIPFDIVLEISGGSPTQSTGRSVLITADVLNRYDNKIICSNFCKVIRTKEEEYSIYLDFLIKYLYFKDFFFQFENGTTGIKNLDFKSLFKYHQILIPPKEIIKDFNLQIITIYEIIHNNGIQSKSLAQIRDSLLPKLMSGKIRVPLEDK